MIIILIIIVDVFLIVDHTENFNDAGFTENTLYKYEYIAHGKNTVLPCFLINLRIFYFVSTLFRADAVFGDFRALLRLLSRFYLSAIY